MSDALDEARRKVEAAVEEYVSILAAEDDEEHGTAMTLGWVVTLEYTQASLEERSATCVVAFGPSTQNRSTSRGLLEFGREKYSLLA